METGRLGRMSLLAALLIMPGCAGPSVVIDPAPYAGPEVRLVAGERTHLALFTMPTGGWGLKFERVRDRFEAQQVFVTLHRPAPTANTSQASVEQLVDTRVRLSRNVELFARIEDGDKPAPGYRSAVRTEKR